MIQIGNIYPTTKDGDVEVINIVKDTLTVKFINSGNTRDCVKCNLMKGMVSDKKHKEYLIEKEKLERVALRNEARKTAFLHGETILKERQASKDVKEAAKESAKKKAIKDKFLARFLKHWRLSCEARNKVKLKEAGRISKPQSDMYNKSSLHDFILPNGKFAESAYVGSKCTPTRSFAVWNTILQRTRTNSGYQKRFPLYAGCSVSPEWLSFQNFATWYTSQNGYNFGWDIDKDALSDSRCYGPSTCIMLPREVNLLFAQRNQDCNLIDATKKNGVPRWRSTDGKFFTDIQKAKEHIHSIKMLKIKILEDKYSSNIPLFIFDMLRSDEVSKLKTSAELHVLAT